MMKKLDPVTLLFLGAVPALAATGSVLSALGMGVAVLLIMLLSVLIIEAVKGLIPKRAHIPACILMVAAVASVVSMLMNAFLPKIYNMLGLYMAVAAADLLIFSRAEVAAKQGLGAALADSALSGLTFLASITVLAVFREVLGGGSFAGITLSFMQGRALAVLVQPSGGLLALALMLAVIQALRPQRGAPAEGFAGLASGEEDKA